MIQHKRLQAIDAASLLSDEFLALLAQCPQDEQTHVEFWELFFGKVSGWAVASVEPSPLSPMIFKLAEHIKVTYEDKSK